MDKSRENPVFDTLSSSSSNTNHHHHGQPLRPAKPGLIFRHDIIEYHIFIHGTSIF